MTLQFLVAVAHPCGVTAANASIHVGGSFGLIGA